MIPERYLTSTGAGERTGLDEANAWGIVEYLANHTRNMLVHVKLGTYSFSENNRHTFVGNQYTTSTVTIGFPLILQGYRSVPGDLNSGPLQDLPVFRVSGNQGHFETSLHSSNIEVRNILFESEVNSGGNATVEVRGHVSFFRCVFLNLVTNSTNPTPALNANNANMSYFEHCFFENMNSHATASSSVLSSISGVSFVGCTFVATKRVCQISGIMPFSECVFRSKTKWAGHAALHGSSTFGAFVRNCVFDSFDVGIHITRPTSGPVFSAVLNCIFVNNNRAIDYSGMQTRNNVTLRNNAVFGPVAFTGFGNDLERIDSKPIVLQDTPFEPGSYVLKNDAVGQQCKNVGSPRYIQHEHTPNPLDLGAAQSWISAISPHDYPQTRDVRFGVPYDNGNFVGTARIPASRDVRHSVAVDDGLGSLSVPDRTRVVWGVPTDDTVGALEHSVVVEQEMQ